MIPQGYVLYVCDTETTSLNYEEGDIIELSMIRLSFTKDNSVVEDQKTWYLRAMNPKGIQDQALAVNHYCREDILGITAVGRAKHLLPVDVISQIENWIMDDNVSSADRVFCGQNPTFDLNYLKSFFKKNGRTKIEDFPFAVENGNRTIDTKMIVALFDLCTGRRRKAYSLGQLVKSCSIKKDKAHSARGDTKMTKDLLLFLIEIIRLVVVEKFKDCYSDADAE